MLNGPYEFSCIQATHTCTSEASVKLQDLQNSFRTTRRTSRTTRTTNRVTRTTLRVVLVFLGVVLVVLEVVLVVLNVSWRSWTVTEASEVWVWVDWRPLTEDRGKRRVSRSSLKGAPFKEGAPLQGPLKGAPHP